MYFSAERLALANQAVKETFEQCSVAWQAIPHWDTRDPSKTQVPNGVVPPGNPLTLGLVNQDFTVTLAEAIAPAPDAVVAAVIANTVKLAALVDDAVFPALGAGPSVTIAAGPSPPTQADLNALIAARALVEAGGYRAPSCLITNTAGLQQLTTLTTSAIPGTNVLLRPADINALQRVDKLAPAKAMALLLGRRQRIAPGGAMEASAGEEALDLAVGILPSLEVIGEAPAPNLNQIQLRVRISFVLRIKDPNGFVVILNP
ncbi:hypothetical protein [Mycobacterium sp.]|uniref:hypothetical protein n=1 Tax=Mycobacterium sp. TaxID=1785 RepID=UPI003F99274B